MTASAWRLALRALLFPLVPEERRVVAAARRRLPPALAEDPRQFLGQHTAGCGATWGVHERCQFACSACYLPEEANATPPLPAHEVTAQLRALRAHLGPWGNVQITAGEVTLLPVESLLDVLRTCRQLQLTPMLMTNGEVLRDDPSYLLRLVREGGLRRLATHVDTTQLGRRGLRRGMRERDLNPLREEFAALLAHVKDTTGVRLEAAHTVTVTPATLPDVPDIMAFLLAHADSWRMVSFQPVARVGRTRPGQPRPDGDALWAAIEAGVGCPLDPHAVPFGHPDCTSVTPLLVVNIGATRHVVQAQRPGSRLDRWFLARLLRGGLAGYNPIGESRRVACARLLGRLVRHPRLLLDVPLFAACRLWSERRVVLRLLGALVTASRVSLHPLTIVVHRFMSADELDTPIGRQRLQACSFRVALDGELVSMCEFNATDARRAHSLALQANRVPPIALRPGARPLVESRR